MTYRDDLEAAHARIAALEAEVASSRDRAEDARRDDAAQDGERARLAEEVKQLRAVVEERRAQISSLRGERDRLSTRVRVLESEQTGRGALPTLWERNRGFPPIENRSVVDVACPACRAIGIESQMVRDAYVPVAAEPGATVAGVSCPSCLFTGVLRER